MTTIPQITDSWETYCGRPVATLFLFPFRTNSIRTAINAWANYSNANFHVPSALRRVNIRRSLFKIEKALRRMCRAADSVEEGINAFKNYIETIKNEGVLTDYAIEMESNDEEVRKARINMTFARAAGAITLELSIQHSQEYEEV